MGNDRFCKLFGILFVVGFGSFICSVFFLLKGLKFRVLGMEKVKVMGADIEACVVGNQIGVFFWGTGSEKDRSVPLG